MSDVFVGAALAHLDQFRLAVALPHDLFDGLPWTEADLRSTRGRIAWDPYAEWLDRMGAAAGSDDAIRAVGASMDDTGAWLALFLRSIVNEAHMLQVWTRLVPYFWRPVTLSLVLGKGAAEVRSELQPGYRGCRTMFCASGAALASLPLRIGLPRLEIVHEEFSDRHGAWVYALPPSQTAQARLQRHWDDFLGALGADRVELDQALTRLEVDREDRLAQARRVGEAGRTAAEATDPLEVARIAVDVAVEACGHSGARLTTADGRIAQRGATEGPSTTVPVRSADQEVARIEAWGTPRYPELLATLTPWLALAFQRIALAERADRERKALAAVTATRSTWIVGPDGVEWANADGRRAEETDPALRERLRALPDGGDAELEVQALAGDVRLIRRREAGLDERRARVVDRWGLTPAQARVLDRVVRGSSNKEVAVELGIEEGTVEAHLGQIFRRSGASNRASLVYAFWTA